MRTPDSAVPPVDAVLEAVRRAIERSSLRRVAEEVDLAPTALSKLLKGAPPRASTVRKLREWYVRRAAYIADTDENTLRAALMVLLQGVPKGKSRYRAVDAVLNTLENAHRESGGRPPEWIRKLREE